jgi:hypothetical protein
LQPFRWNGFSTGRTYGRVDATTNRYSTEIARLVISGESPGNNGRRHITETAAPVAGEWARGDRVYNRDPSAGGHEGWQCVAGGTPGTWAKFGYIELSGSATFDPSNLADGAGETTTVTVTGAALGDYAQASFSLNLQGITVTAWVSAADTVSVRFQNESGGALDLASGTLRARVTKL